MGLTCGWFTALWSNPLADASQLALAWSVRGSDIQKQIQAVNDLHDTSWAPSAIVTLFAGKGSLKDADIITPEAFAEILPVYVRFMNLSVTTGSGLVYSARDLCARGIMPDTPGGPVMPCLVASPIDCFSETTQTLDRSYAAIDPIINIIMSSEPALVATPYATRPSFRNLSAAQMKVEVSKMRSAGVRGCLWWTGTTVYEPGTWAGGLEWNSDKSLVTKATTLALSFALDTPARAAYRMSLSKPHLANKSEIAEALKLLDHAWSTEVKAYGQTTTLLEVANLAVDAAAEAESVITVLILIIVGFLLMQFYQIFMFASWRYPLLSRANMVYLGLSAAGLSILPATGIMLMGGMPINSVILGSLPLLAYRLGLDHLFVLMGCFDDLGLKFITEHENSEIMSVMFGKAGLGLTLTTLCNVVAFGLGAILPVQGVAEFCICYCIISFFSFFLAVTVMPRVFVMEANRIRAQKPDPYLLTYFCHRRKLKRAASEGLPELRELEGSVSNFKTRFVNILEKRLAPALSSRLGQLVVVALVAGLVAASSMGISGEVVGYKPKDLLPSGSNANRALELYFERFSSFPAWLCFVDVDVPASQSQMLALYDDLTQGSNVEPGIVSPYLSDFYLYVYGVGQVPVPGHANMTMQALGWKLDSSYRQQHYAPLGIASTDATVFYKQFTAYRTPPQNPALAFAPGGNSFSIADVTGTNEFGYSGNPLAPQLRFSFFDFNQIEIHSDADILESAADLKTKTDSSPLKGKAFYYSELFVLWSVFQQLEAVVPWILAIYLGVIACFTLLLLRSLTAAALAVVSCGMIMLEAYGLSMFFVQFNIFLCGLLLSAGAVSILHTAHVLAAFFQEEQEEPPAVRMSRSLQHASKSMIHGSISVFLFILPQGFSSTALTVKYTFAALSLVLLLALINGLLVLPALLNFFSCGACSKGVEEPDADPEMSAPQVSLPTVLAQPRQNAIPSKDSAKSTVVSSI